jgi:catechol 2,3-dioxygenase-like lactoylglutathione lyase family enzyme
VLTIGVVALGVTDVRRAAEFWSRALGYELREDGFGGWATVLTPPGGYGTKIALQRSETPPQEHPRLHLDLAITRSGSSGVMTGLTRGPDSPGARSAETLFSEPVFPRR